MKGDRRAEDRIASEPGYFETALGSLALESHKAFEKLGVRAGVPPGREVFRQGFFSDDVYYIESGLIKLVCLTKHGQEAIVGLRAKGWVLGAVSVISNEANSVTAITVTQSLLWRMCAKAFVELVKNDSHFSWYIHEQHTQEIRDQVAHLVRLASFSARQRLEHLLSQLISALEPKGSESAALRLMWPLMHYEIAQLISVTPQHLSRLLKKMQQEGILRLRRGWVIIPDAERLMRDIN